MLVVTCPPFPMGGGGARSVVSRRPSNGGQCEPSVLIGRRGCARTFGCCGRMGFEIRIPPLLLGYDSAFYAAIGRLTVGLRHAPCFCVLDARGRVRSARADQLEDV